MNIVVLQENINDSLARASKFLPSKTSTVTSVNNFLLSAKDGVISLQATDLETKITTIIAGKVEEEGVVVLPSKPSLSLFSLFSGEKITLYTEKGELIIKGEKTHVSLKTESAEAFPQDEKLDEGKTIAVQSSVLHEIVEKNGFSVSGDQARAELTGVFLSFSKKGLSAVSTDGFRLSVFNSKTTSSGWEGSFVLPMKAVRAFSSISKKEKSTVFHYFEKQKKVSYSGKQDKIITRLIDGTYPDYNKIVPTSAQTTMSVDKQELTRAVKLSSVFARESANIVRLSIKGKTLTVSANAAQTGKNKTELSVKNEGEDVDAAFNYRFLLDMLSAINQEEIVFETSGPLQPGVFHYGKKQEYFHIIMPVRLQDSK